MAHEPDGEGGRSGAGSDRNDPEQGADRILAEIGALGSLAALEERLADLEGGLGRLESAVESRHRARHGELTLMRARLEDALEVVRSAVAEQRAGFLAFSDRHDARIAQLGEASDARTRALRDELVPATERVVAEGRALHEQMLRRHDALVAETAAGESAVADRLDRLEPLLEAVVASCGARPRSAPRGSRSCGRTPTAGPSRPRPFWPRSATS